MIKDTVIHELIKQLKRIKVETVYSRSVSSDALEQASNLNRLQLEQGVLDSGEIIGGYKKATEGYNNVRTTKVIAGEPIKFKDTGAFHKSIRAKITRDGDLALTSRSKKAIYAQDYVDGTNKSGSVLGLTDENLKDWYEVFVEEQFKKNLINRILYGQ
ncbi:MAG: hypothetical protein RIR48_1349 [Bacteroidota bacterium]|jgi:hypothetical protein